jgi:cytochrome c oxidase assembly factor CtaG
MVDIGLNFWLTQWNWAPSIIIGTVIVLGSYLYAVGLLRNPSTLIDGVKQSQVISFWLGILVIFFALVSPIDEIGDRYLFSMHMVQHLLLTIVGPPLLLLGTPEVLLKPIIRNRFVFPIAKVLTHPFLAFFLFNADFWLWHAPPLYDATLTNQNLHILEHLTFIVFGVIYWWPIFSPMKEDLPRLSIGGQVLYLFFSGMPIVALGAGLTFAPPLYTPYINAPRIWGLSAATDQQLGGLIMWIPGNILYIGIVSILFIRWMQQQEAKQRAREAMQDEQITEGEVVDQPS